MITFIENEATKLKFVSYPLTKLISYLIILAIVSPFLWWTVCVTPVYSLLSCSKINTDRIDCLLQEKSLLNLPLLNTEIKSIKKVDRYIFGLSNGKQITLRANPDSSSFKLIGYQEKYHYPSKSFTLFTLNPKFGFKIFQQRSQLIKFVKGKLNSQSITVQQQVGWFILFAVVPLFSMVLGIVRWILTYPFKTIYEFDGTNRKLILSGKTVLGFNIESVYSFDKIEQFFIDKKDLDMGGRIILQFIPEYNYQIEEFLDSEYGEKNYQIINEFIKRYK